MDLTERVRNYAMGNQDVVKYKQQLGYSSSNTYLKIDWTGGKRIRKMFIKSILRVSRLYKAKRAIKRMMNYGKH